MNIYELTEMEKNLIATLEDADVPEADRATIIAETMEGAGLTDKLDSYGKVMQALESDIDTIEKEIARLTAMKKSVQNNINKMTDSLLWYMDSTGKTKEKTATFSFGIRESMSTNIVDESIVPTEYLKTKTETSVDKASVLKALKSGTTVAGCEIKTTRKAYVK